MGVVKLTFLMIVAGSLLAGCAIPNAEIEVPVEKPSVRPTKAAVTIVVVQDKRQFVIDPVTPSRPSIEGNEVENKSLTARALGRKRGMFGQAGGNIYLPEGQSVVQLVERVLAAALAEKGYAVIPKVANGDETALALSADIEKFWGWTNPGAAVRITFESRIRLTGPWPLTANRSEFEGHASYSYLAVGDREWSELLKSGVSDLQQNVAKALK
jgi:hypothetical protein